MQNACSVLHAAPPLQSWVACRLGPGLTDPPNYKEAGEHSFPRCPEKSENALCMNRRSLCCNIFLFKCKDPRYWVRLLVRKMWRRLESLSRRRWNRKHFLKDAKCLPVSGSGFFNVTRGLRPKHLENRDQWKHLGEMQRLPKASHPFTFTPPWSTFTTLGINITKPFLSITCFPLNKKDFIPLPL